MKGVQCYELFGGITLKNHAFLLCFLLILPDTKLLNHVCHTCAPATVHPVCGDLIAVHDRNIHRSARSPLCWNDGKFKNFRILSLRFGYKYKGSKHHIWQALINFFF